MSEKIFDPVFTESGESLEAYADFVAIVRQLRRDCPWDQVQTHESVKHLLIEEAYETVEAIDDEDWTQLRKELGDILLHVVFHSVMAAEEGTFTLKDVIDSESEKLIRRHPHVFGDTEVDNVQDVLTNWETIKIREGEKKSAMEGVPRNLPALLRAFRIQEKAAGVGFDFPAPENAWEKVDEELGEFKALLAGDASTVEKEKELGDLFFALINYSRLSGLNPENALGRTNDKFIRRFQGVEKGLEDEGISLVDANLEQMDAHWDRIKKEERT
ncbi:MAG: nucleoside triphosphate pyrophosphohydrolase [Rhodothermales bacterium]|nr:nucleoside triphosphate pyrophosphohydrolase [Rhodothermales bacterium]MDG2017063.1 nucleoside triphosphate pyrophosphohydrolase [Rhodothermales bacterium]HAY37030.1 nucleoside triphosphate pyrophosphohydrolase [Bacteroidota bacterium]